MSGERKCATRLIQKKPTTVANNEWFELSEESAGGMENLVHQALEKQYSVELLQN